MDKSMDKELTAMKTLYDVLQELSEDERHRVFQWMSSKFSVSVTSSKKAVLPFDQSISTGDLTSSDGIADFFSQYECNTDSDKALVVASYLQGVLKKEDLASREINDELKHLGFALKNVTRSIQLLIDRKPQLMIQTRKKGKSKQAQKKYRVTQEGFKALESLRN